MSGATVLIGKDALSGFVREIFVAHGVGDDHAALWAEVMVWADLRGNDTHGVSRVPRYVENLREGGTNPHPDLTIVREDGAMAVVDADYAPGPVGMCFAMERAIVRAREAHAGWCLARRTTHAGAIGYYAKMAADAGMIGIVMTASRPLMAYHGARGQAVATNPIAFAAPGGGGPPVLLDFATSAISNGAFMRAQRSGESLPEGAAIDADGNPTTDVTSVAALLPLGGPKGSGLSLMIEIVCSLVAGFPILERHFGYGTKPPGIPQNGVAVAVDLAAFRDPADYAHDLSTLADIVHGLPRVPGVETLYLPGERGHEEYARRAVGGIPLPRTTWTRLIDTARDCGVVPPNLG